MVITAMVAGLLMAGPVADKWELKPGIEPKAKGAWTVAVEVNVPDEQHRAEFTLVREIGVLDGENYKAICSWEKLVVDDEEMDAEARWDVSIAPRGAIVATTDTMGDDIRRMLSPMAFVYPEAAVGEGDKWNAEVRPYKGKDDYLLTYAYEVKGIEKVGDVDALRVAAVMTEKGEDAMQGEGTWWIGKNGQVLKFEVKVKNWVVPMAGGEPMEAKITGQRAKPVPAHPR